MITVEEREAIRIAHLIEGHSLRQIEREQHHGRRAIHKALTNANEERYHRSTPRGAPKMGPYEERVKALLGESAKLPRKQRYTIAKMHEVLKGEGFQGTLSALRSHLWKLGYRKHKPERYLPLAYDLGADMQVDWGEAQVEMDGEIIVAHYLVMRLCASRKVFVRSYPTQNQESFFEGQALGFEYLGGVAESVWYDNLKSAVLEVLQGKSRREQRMFVAFRSHYLFKAVFCTPGEGHEKGGVESEIGYVRRNAFVPMPKVSSWDELNAHLVAWCGREDERQVHGQPTTIGEAWRAEQPHLRALPPTRFACCVTTESAVNGYSQITFKGNTYSVPAEQAQRRLTVKGYPFRVDIVHLDSVVAIHPRSYKHGTEVLDPLHYLSLLEHRPGAFEHAKPMRLLRAGWPPVYERALEHVRAHEGRGLPEFIRILKLLRDHPPEQVETALTQTLALGCVSVDAVKLHLRHLQQPDPCVPDWNWSPQTAANFSTLNAMASPTICLKQYDTLLTAEVWHG